MNITEDQWTPEEDEELTPESLVSRLLNESPTLENFVRGMQDMDYLLTEEYERGKRITKD
jgi:hypothetical protein